ncbi:hypothetical protein FOYG_16138 [Fusarium oxysporum NRRL 32931]|uniref:NACHT domain-containing protein n=1 Tax=Fusarium oxysporum NRRL 32931 TaxID=660029 RepID=W9HI84_FUSOX|nr:hypothetical protein FOYG_16138 [Fusarium oxysporum NRRL 32931]
MVIECRKDPSDLMLAEPWDDDELRITFQRLSSLESLPLHFCSFIDGLDEYTAGKQRYTGIFEELLAPLRVLASSPSIKLCVSSRPWNSFDKEFGRLEWKLQLEDLTREDSRSYVTEQLGADQKFQELSNNNPQCSEIPETIVQRAQGVFLWVFLVVNSLLRGLCNDDSYTDLQQRLNELPDDLYRYFEHMLYSIENVYWDSTTELRRCARLARLQVYAGRLFASSARSSSRTNKEGRGYLLRVDIVHTNSLDTIHTGVLQKRCLGLLKGVLDVEASQTVGKASVPHFVGVAATDNNWIASGLIARRE